jgi:predicted phosphodiesterase
MTDKILSVKDDILKLFVNGASKADAARYIQENADLGWSQSKYWAKVIYDQYYRNYNTNSEETEGFNKSEEKELENDLEYKDKYVYNQDDDKYVFLLHKSLGKNVVLDGSVIRGITKSYTNYDDEPTTINETALKYRVPRNVLIQVLRILGITHDAIPFTPEDIKDREEEELVDEYINDKMFSIQQKIQKKDWKKTKDDAKQWNEFIAGQVDPICNYLDNWTPPNFEYIPKSFFNREGEKSNKVFMSVLTDNHIGELTENAFDGTKYDTDKAIDNIYEYLRQIEESVSNRTYTFDKVVLVCLGDILNSCLDGMTRKGTKLDNDIINENMFDVGLDVLVSFITGLESIFGNVEVKCTKGNHDGILSYAMYRACEKFFSKNENVSFDITKKYVDYFKVNNTFFLYTHGATDTIRTSLPKSGNKLESFVQSLLLKKAEELVGVKGKYILSGHTHSFEHIEYNQFEHIVCSASVNSDEYAEALGYHSRPRQQGFVLGTNYIEETIHFNL